MKKFGDQEVRQFLTSHGLETQIHSFTESTENAYLAAEALGVELGQIVKSVVFVADGKPVLVLMSGDMNVDTKKLKNLLGVRKARIADAETVAAVTGYPVGAVPPVAHRQNISAYLDLKLQAMQCYSSQLKPFPHTRSLESLKALARLRGGTVSPEAAEAFVLVRQIDS